MNIFSRTDIFVLFLSMALMLGSAWFLAEIFRRLKLPAVAGEILAGIILGPTIFGRISPSIYASIFPSGYTSVQISLESFILIGAVLLLLVAGLEIDLSSVISQGKNVIIISAFSITIPFCIGAYVAYNFPGLFGNTESSYALSVFIGISVSITALPLIARILMNIQLFHSDIGMLIMTMAVITDLAGWLLFSLLIQLVHTGGVDLYIIIKTILLTIAISLFILTILRNGINRILPWIQAKTEWPGGIISFTIITGFILAAMTEAIGIHAIFSAFLAGIAIGDSPHLREQTRSTITQFVDNIFAPLFFVSIGLRIDFLDNFSPALPLIMLSIILFGKFSSVLLASRFIRMKIRESLAVASGMSSSGAMGIILGIFALQNGLISSAIFEAIVITAVTTSLISGPLMKFFLKQKESLKLIDLLDNGLYIRNLKAQNAIEAIILMSRKLGNIDGISGQEIAEKVISRENMMSTGIGNSIAVPHARFYNLKKTVIITAQSESGIDFNAVDGKDARLIFMILTPFNDQQSQIQILADISGIFQNKEIRERTISAKTYNEFIAAIKPSYFKQ